MNCDERETVEKGHAMVKAPLLGLTKKPDFLALEHAILQFWDSNDIFELLRKKNCNGPPYSFFDGPITANNAMGVHHAFGRTLKDVYQRYYAMCGYRQRYQNGFDCQGLWLEVEVERALELNSKRDIKTFGEEQFAYECRSRVQHYSQLITQQSKRLGQWMDWGHDYFTYDDNNIEHIWYFLKECHRRGWLYRDHRVMPWCPRCGTSLSAHEMAESYQDLTHQAVYLRLPVVGQENTYFLVWTTTPWTLTANVALAINPNLPYLLVMENSNFYYVAAGTQSVLNNCTLVKQCLGKDLLGLLYIGPFEELFAQKQVTCRRVIAWTDVSNAEGTGIVHIAPGCGAEDYELGVKEKLEFLSPVDDEGRYITGYEPFTGKATKEVQSAIFEVLQQKKMLYKVTDYTHRYPICWRCKTELIFKLEYEWFLASKEIRPLMQTAAQQVHWEPDHMREAMMNWLTTMGDWCISRKRYWGLPLPLYPCHDCGTLTLVANKVELKQLAVQPQIVDSLPELHKPWIDRVEIYCPICGKIVKRVSEVGDCWLDAGIIPYSTLNYLQDPAHQLWKEWFPSELVIEMREQVRLWFYSLLYMSITLTGTAPYKQVLAYDEVRDEQGNRFSKSDKKRNIVFDEAVERMGADVMRWMYTNANLKVPLRFGYSLGEDVQKKLLMLWNMSYFLYSSMLADNLSSDDLQKFRKLPKKNVMDRWILAELQSYISQVTTAYRELQPHEILQQSENFFELVSNWYIRFNRRRFWKNAQDSDKKEAYGALYDVLLTLFQCLAPVIPFLTEHLFQNIAAQSYRKHTPSVHLTPFPKPMDELKDYELCKKFQRVQEVISLTLRLRNKAHKKVRIPLQSLQIYLASSFDKEAILMFQEQILFETNVKNIDFVTDLSQSVNYVIKPNYQLLGPKYRDNLQLLLQQLREIPYERLHSLFNHPTNLIVNLGNYSIELTPNEYQINVIDKSGHATVFEDNLGLSLDLSSTLALEVEGYVREIIRYMQNLRKEIDVIITEKVLFAVQLTGAKKSINDEFLKHLSYISEETLAYELLINTHLPRIEKEIQFELDEITITIQIAHKAA